MSTVPSVWRNLSIYLVSFFCIYTVLTKNKPKLAFLSQYNQVSFYIAFYSVNEQKLSFQKYIQ
jgi:hypothetical protein